MSRLAAELAATRARDRRRRASVLSHPDLAAMLTVHPLSFKHPGQWSGYIPPGQCGAGGPNGSPRRAALIAICIEAAARECRDVT